MALGASAPTSVGAVFLLPDDDGQQEPEDASADDIDQTVPVAHQLTFTLRTPL